MRNVEYTIKILTEFFNIVLHGLLSIRTLDNKFLLVVHNADVIGSLLDRDNEFDEGAGNDVLTVLEVNSYDWGTTDGLLVVLYTISIHHLENTTQTVNALDDGLLVSRRTGTCHWILRLRHGELVVKIILFKIKSLVIQLGLKTTSIDFGVDAGGHKSLKIKRSIVRHLVNISIHSRLGKGLGVLVISLLVGKFSLVRDSEFIGSVSDLIYMNELRVNLRLCISLLLGIGKTLLEDSLKGYDIKILVFVLVSVDILVLLNLERGVTGLRVIGRSSDNADRSGRGSSPCEYIVSLVSNKGEVSAVNAYCPWVQTELGHRLGRGVLLELIHQPTVLIASVLWCNSLLVLLVVSKRIVGDGLEKNRRNSVIVVLRNQGDAAETVGDDAEDSVDSCVELSFVLLNLLIEFGDLVVKILNSLVNLRVKFGDLILKLSVLCVKSREFSLENTLLGIGSDHVLELLGEECTEVLGVELVCLKSGVHLLKRGDLTLKSANLSILAESLLQRLDVAEGESCVTLSLVSGGLSIVSGLLSLLNGGLKTRNIPLKGRNPALEGGDGFLGGLKVSLQST